MFDQTNGKDALEQELAAHESLREAALDLLAEASEFMLIAATDEGEFTPLVSIAEGRETDWIIWLLAAANAIAAQCPQAGLDVITAIAEEQIEEVDHDA
jgi:hypothetical protein